MARRAIGVIATEFEENIRSFLKRCGFADVDGGREFRLGEQIDACGGFEDTLLIIECKTGPKKGKPLLDEIKLLRGKMDKIKKVAKTHETYGKYTDFRFVLGANFVIRQADREEAQAEPSVFLWDGAFLEYYKDLLGKIGEYAKYNLLGELDVKPRVTHIIQVPCFRSKLKSETIYAFFADPKEILKWAYVARREIGRERYYQRIVERGRLRRIAAFLDKGGYFPNAPILAFNVQPDFKAFPEVKAKFPAWGSDLQFGSLGFPATYRSCWIVDGQHRLYGLSKSGESDLLMPMVALEGASVESQAQLFLDINKNQKPVPSDLVWDLEGEMRPNTPEGVISKVVKALNSEGHLEGQIYIPMEGRKKRRQLKLSGMCSAIKKRRITNPILEHKFENPLFSDDPDKVVRTVSQTLNRALEVSEDLFEDWQLQQFWRKNTGIAIFIALVEPILAHCKRNPSPDDFRKYLGPLNGHMERYRGSDALKKLRQRCNSEGGRNEVAEEFLRTIRKQTEEKNFAPHVKEFEFEDRIKGAERGLAALVARVLAAKTSRWFKERVPEDVRKTIVDRQRRDRTVGGPIENFMSLGEVGLVLNKKPNQQDLEPCFIVKGGFHDIAEVQHAFKSVNRLRGRLSHGRASLGDADEMLLDAYLSKFETVIRMSMS